MNGTTIHTSPPAMTSAAPTLPPFSASKYIKEIGRGVNGARALPREDAQMLFDAMLAGRVSDIELGRRADGLPDQGRGAARAGRHAGGRPRPLRPAGAAAGQARGRHPQLQRRAQAAEPGAAAGAAAGARRRAHAGPRLARVQRPGDEHAAVRGARRAALRHRRRPRRTSCATPPIRWPCCRSMCCLQRFRACSTSARSSACAIPRTPSSRCCSR